MRKFILLLLPAILSTFLLKAQTSILPFGSSWSYKDDGSNQGTTWRSSVNNAWKTGKGMFGVGPGVNGVVTTITLNQGYVTTYFTKNITMNNPGAITTYFASIKRDDGAVVYVNGTEVYRNNMPTGTIAYNTLASASGDKGKTPVSFNISSSAFINGNNVIAVEVHQKANDKNEKDMAFDLEITADLTPPTVSSINRQSPTSTTTNAHSVTFTTTFSEPVTGVDASDFTATTVSGSSTGSVTGVTPVGTTGTTYNVTVSSITGDGSLQLDLNSSGTGITDAVGNAITSGFTSGQSYTFDFTGPVVNSINRQNPITQTVSATSVTYRVIFSEAVTGVDATDFSTTAVTGNVTGTVSAATAVAGTGNTTYDVTVSSITGGGGDLRLDLKASGTGINDALGNAISSGFTAGQVYTILAPDNTPPTVVSSVRFNPSTTITNATTVTFRMTFSESVTGVDVADFIAKQVSGVVSGIVSSVTGSGSVYDITVSSVTGNGLLRLDLKATGTGIVDAANNPIATGYTGGQKYTIDQTAPAVLSINRQVPVDQTTSAISVTYRVTFSEAVTGLNVSNFAVTATNTATGNVTAVKGSGTVYDVFVNPTSGDGDLRLDLSASATSIIDAGGNPIAGGFTSGQVYTLVTPPPTTGFSSMTTLSTVPLSDKTADKPQAKVWNNDGYWWTVLPSGGATKIFRLDGTTWTPVTTLTSSSTRADYWMVGNVMHFLLYKSPGASLIVSVEYDPVNHTYIPWSQRPTASSVQFPVGAQIGTIIVDGNGRMWVAADGTSDVSVWWSDAPYSSWSGPITLATGIIDDDMCTLANLQGKIGLFWSNQTTGFFGFRTHNNGDDPNTWSADEVPASQSAVANDQRMSDNHMNVVTASDGTLYCAVKTSYDAVGFPQMALLVRRPNGVWDDLHPVTIHEGTQPCLILNEVQGKIKVVYTTLTNGGDLVYRESNMSDISFGPTTPIFSGGGTTLYHFAASTHQTYNPDVVIIGTNLSTSPMESVSVLASDASVAPLTQKSNQAPSNHTLGNTDASGKTPILASPNPFSSTSLISFTLPHDGAYTLNLQDSRGSKIAQLAQGWGKAGLTYTARVDGSRLSSGLYVVSLQNGGITKTLKVMVSK